MTRMTITTTIITTVITTTNIEYLSDHPTAFTRVGNPVRWLQM